MLEIGQLSWWNNDFVEVDDEEEEDWDQKRCQEFVGCEGGDGLFKGDIVEFEQDYY